MKEKCKYPSLNFFLFIFQIILLTLVTRYVNSLNYCSDSNDDQGKKIVFFFPLEVDI